MIKIEIPEFKVFNAEHLVLDFNGTLAIDGLFIEGVIGQLVQISANLKSPDGSPPSNLSLRRFDGNLLTPAL